MIASSVVLKVNDFMSYKAKLSNFSNDFNFSDRTVKVWDLETGLESLTLSGHPNNVVAVKYSVEHRLLFSISAAYVKVWDLRSGNSCIKTLFSSGQAQSGPLALSTPSRTLQLPVGETTINDVALSLDEKELYTATSDKVRVWDLRKLTYTGRLSTAHTAAVMCLAVAADGRVITGSKDHLIALVEPNTSGQSVSLVPPHYDGVQCLTTYNSTLFSGTWLSLCSIIFFSHKILAS